MKKICASLSVFTLVLGVLLTTLAVTPSVAQDWPMFGQDVTNSASPQQTSLTQGNVGRLQLKWTFTTGGDVSARAALVNGVLYFPDWAGNLYAVNANSGQTVWSHQLSYYGLAAGTVSRTSPAVANGVVYIGTQYNASDPTSSGWLLAINAANGQLLWKKQPDTSNAFPVITASPAVAGGVVYVGMTSNEEFAAANPYYPCCSVDGSVVALNATTGAKLWQTFTAPSGYSGANVWGSNSGCGRSSQHGFRRNRKQLQHSDGPGLCLHALPAEAPKPVAFLPADHADSIIALDMKTGAVKWATRLMTWNQYGVTDGSDFWNVACFTTFTNCPPSPGPRLRFRLGSE